MFRYVTLYTHTRAHTKLSCFTCARETQNFSAYPTLRDIPTAAQKYQHADANTAAWLYSLRSASKIQLYSCFILPKYEYDISRSPNKRFSPPPRRHLSRPLSSLRLSNFSSFFFSSASVQPKLQRRVLSKLSRANIIERTKCTRTRARRGVG